MAGEPTSSSRMGVTLQGLDQVIALSQANINESLEYHFTSNKELCKFEASLKTQSKEALKGTLKPPTIELVDIERGDQALYCLEFEDGEYSFWSFAEAVDDEPPKVTKTKYSAKGWRLAFYVEFAMQKMATVPKNIADQIQLPGSYSVNQLLVDFGTADAMKFNWEKSKVMGFPKDEDAEVVKDTIQLFVTKWLSSLTRIDNTGSHNVLGSAVKIDPPPGKTLKDVLDAIPKSTPSFPPTVVRLQTINHRPGGDINRSSTDNDHNAFLFTEMTEGRPLPNSDLQWSGDWFYESIGGSLAMSRLIFWDKFIAKRIRQVNVQAVEGANSLARVMSLTMMPQSWLLSDSNTINEGAWTSTNELESIYEWNSTKRNTYEHEVTGPNPQFEFDVETHIRHSLKPFPGTGKIILNTSLTMKAKQNVNISFIPGFVSGADIDSTVSTTSVTNIQFHSVTETGELGVDVKTEEPTSNAKSTMSQTSFLMKIPGIGPILEDLTKKLADTRTFEEQVTNVIKDVTRAMTNIETPIQEALNGQGRFIFPGGGTFDMKDPIFNNAGDLMVGLTYRKEAA